MTGPGPLPAPGWASRWPGVVGLAVAYFAAGKLGLLLPIVQGNVTLLWAPSGIALGVLARSGAWPWPGIFLGALAVNISTGLPAAAGLAIAAGNTLEALVGLGLLRRFDHGPGLGRVRDVLGLVGTAVACPVVASSVGSAALYEAGLVSEARLAPAFGYWWLGDAMGILVVVPPILTWDSGASLRAGLARRLEMAAVLAGPLALGWVGLLCVGVLSITPLPLGAAVFPFLVWATLRFGPRGAAWVNLVAVAMGIGAVAGDLNPFGLGPMLDELVRLYSYMGVTAATSLIMAAFVAELDGARARSRQGEEELRLSIHAGGVGVWSWDVDDDRVAWSDKIYEIHGMPPGAFEGTVDAFARTLHPDDRAGVLDRIARALDGRDEYRLEMRIVRPGGEVRWVSTTARVLDDGLGRRRMLGATVDVTDRKRAEQELAANEERFRQIVETANEGIWILDADARVAFSNPRMGEILGYEPAEMLGRPLWDFQFREDRAPSEAAFARRREGLSEELDVRFRHRDGREVWTLMAARPRFDPDGRFAGALDLFTDITARRRAEQELRRTRDLLRGVVDNSPSAIFVKDADGRYILVNRTFARLAGRDEASLLGKTDLDLFTPEEAGQARRDDLRVMASGVAEAIEEVVGMPGAERRTYHTIKFPIGTGDGPASAICGIATDVTEQRRALDVLRAADRRKDEFLATLAHELRNPLAPISNGLEVLNLLAEGGEESARVRETMGRQLRQMTRLVDDLLDLSRIHEGKVRLRREVVELSRVVELALEASRPPIEAKGHDFATCGRGEGIFVDADPARLAQVVSNLLNNAAKYTPPGGAIELEAGLDGGQAVVTVRDSGVGIPREMLGRVFDLFTQVPGSSGQAEGGLGIGLTLVRSLVELHGGSVSASSEGPGCGSTFEVRLPAVACPSPAARTRGPNGVAARPRVDPGLRVLVVDDNADSAKTLARLLRLAGHEARAAFEGSEAVSAAAEFRPDVIFLDIGLPGMDGCQVARAIRDAGPTPPPVLVAMTGYGQDDDRRRTREAGFDRHLVKPVPVEHYHEVLAAVAAAKAPPAG